MDKDTTKPVNYHIIVKMLNVSCKYKRLRKSKGQSRMDNREKLATLGTHDNKKTQHKKLKKMSNTSGGSRGGGGDVRPPKKKKKKKKFKPAFIHSPVKCNKRTIYLPFLDMMIQQLNL